MILFLKTPEASNRNLTVTVTVHSSAKQGNSAKVSVIGLDGRAIASQKGPSDEEFSFKVERPKLWSPSSPILYNLTVTLGDDEISSYTGFRTIATGKVKGIQRPLLNGEFTFMFGTLDQGFWPDGLYAPPNREALVYDLKMLKGLGFNTIRKHVRSPFLSTRSFFD
jgi:beta-galactosidase/beta-glucuronidase